MVRGEKINKCLPSSMELPEVRDWIEKIVVATKTRQETHGTHKQAGTFEAAAERYLRQIDGSLKSIKDRKLHIKQWADRFKGRNPYSITGAEIREQLNTWRSQGYAESSINHRLSALSDFFRKLADKRKGGFNPARDVERGREEKRIPPARPFTEIRKVLDEFGDNVTGARARCLAYTGMRASQLMRLQREAIDLKRCTVRVPQAKNGEATEIVLSRQGLEAFSDLIRFAEDTELPEISRHHWGKRFSNSSLNKALGIACKAADVPRFNPYVFRHSLATHLLDKGASLRDVQYQLGHSDIRMTERYTKPSQERLRKVMERL
jgi:integrase